MSVGRNKVLDYSEEANLDIPSTCLFKISKSIAGWPSFFIASAIKRVCSASAWAFILIEYASASAEILTTSAIFSAS